MAGVASSLNLITQEEYPALLANVQQNGYCYSFTYLFRSARVRDANEGTAQLMLERTVVLGVPVAPIPSR